MSKILIIEDEEAIADLEKDYLELSGFELEIEHRGDVGLKRALEEDFDLFILDLMLPEVDGFEICREIRNQKNTPIIMVSAKKDDIDKIRGLGLGADDYIVKPFLPKELTLRIGVILRRCYKEEQPVACLAACSIDFERAQVIKEGERLPLTAKEFALLSALYRNGGKIVTIDMLCQAVWGDNPYGYENSLMAHIRRIREKIEENPSKPVSLITVKGLGYKLMVKE